MNYADGQRIQINRTYIIKNVRYSDIKDELRENVLNLKDDEEISSENSNEGKMGKLLDLLPYRKKNAYSEFYKSLKVYPHVQEKLDSTDIKNTIEDDDAINLEESVKGLSLDVNQNSTSASSIQCENTNSLKAFTVSHQVKLEQKSEKIIKREEVSDASEQKQKNNSPEVFISYEWGKQEEMKCLYKRLTEMGFRCWMDIDQMGGGDSLNDKIDRGVRGSQVVLCSVTEKYTLSANCKREVCLADSLKKPIIPMLLEKIDWPPKGSMSMVFTEKLFVNFYREPEVHFNWTGPQFDELVLKLREHIPEGDAQKKMNNENVMPKNSRTSSSYTINEGDVEGASLQKDIEHEKNTEMLDAVGKASPYNDCELNERKAVLDRVNVKMEGEVTRQAQKEFPKI